MSILCLTPRRTQPSFALQIQLFHPIQASRLLFGGDKSSKMLGGDKSSKGWRKGRRKKNFSRGEKFFKVFFGLDQMASGKKHFLGCEKFIFSPRHSTFQTRKSCSSRNKGPHFLLRTGSNNHKHGQQLQENELSAKLLQNHSLPKKNLFSSRKVFSMSLAMETVSEHPPRLTEFS